MRLVTSVLADLRCYTLHAGVLLCGAFWQTAREGLGTISRRSLSAFSRERRNFARNACSARMNKGEQFAPQRGLNSRAEAAVSYLALRVFLLEWGSVNYC